MDVVGHMKTLETEYLAHTLPLEAVSHFSESVHLIDFDIQSTQV